MGETERERERKKRDADKVDGRDDRGAEGEVVRSAGHVSVFL